MKNLLYIFLIIPICLSGQKGDGKFELRVATEKDLIICNHSNQYVPNYSPRKKYNNKNLKSKGATFIPSYGRNVPEDFKPAVEFTFDAISDFISSDVPINVGVTFLPFESASTLAAAGPGGFVRNFPGAAYLDTDYPIALAEKLAGEDLNGEGALDLFIQINSDQSNWNTIPDNPDIGNEFDLATVLMHEVLHGLGFTAGSNVDEDTGAGILSPLAFSRALENVGGVNVLDGFIQNTQGMARQLTQGNLFYKNAESETGVRYRLYAPADYQPGSSVSHLDRTVYQGTVHRMMSPVADRGDINYDPGISADIMHSMGWSITSIVHDPARFSLSESVDEDYLVTAKVNSDIGFDTSSFVFHYSSDTFNLEDNVVPLDYNSNSEEFSFLLPATGEEFQYQYYFELDETGGRKRLVPVRANQVFFTYNLGPDRTPPIIDGHIPLESINETDVEFTLSVNDINDFFVGVDTSSLSAVISLNGVLDTLSFETVQSEFEDFNGEFSDFFEVTFKRPEAFELTDELLYKIILKDKGTVKNEGSLPENGFFTVDINDVPEPVVTYLNDFETESDDFSGSGFSVRTESQFTNPAIHSAHPYRNAGEGNSLNFTYDLNQLILVDAENPVIKFDEIVIVEPGEAGTSCRGANCPAEFWDYVIIEAKKLGESEWIPLLNAYDSRDNAAYADAYADGLAGSPSLYRPKTISLIDNGIIDIGDQIFIRFRLFSDPFAVGWGWAIDNLSIQPINTSTLDEKYIEAFEVYPNPIANNQILTLNIQLKEKFDGELSLINTSGQRLINTKINNQNDITAQWDLSNLTAGIYYAQLKSNEGVSVRKIIVN